MLIREYKNSDIEEIFILMLKEEEEWQYAHKNNRNKYTRAMENSIAYVIEQNNALIGYIRCKNDDGFGIYILDLLVDKPFRRNGYGRKLMKKICDTYPDDTIYVTSGADLYYEKQGCKKEGSIFSVNL